MISVLPKPVAEAVVDPKAYAEWNGLHEKLAWARLNAPVAVAETEGFDPFWLITRHADIVEIGKRPQVFASGDRLTTLTPRNFIPLLKAAAPDHGGHIVRSLVQMDQPDHMKYRLLTQAWFMPKNLKTIEERVREIAKDTADQMLALGNACDFARDVAALYPLRVIMSILGVPREDEPRMLMLTQQLFGSTDPELNRTQVNITDPELALQMLKAVLQDFNDYFEALVERRRADPADDIATVLANATIDGKPIPAHELGSYFIIIATAGHDTTSASTAGAMQHLAADPALFERFRSVGSDRAGLIDEAIRITTPVQHFMRSARADCEVGGEAIAAGDWIMLNYVSANRDEAVFADPARFDPDRPRNKQIAFGFGPHVCLGQHLARLEMAALFEELLPRLARVELTGAPARVESAFVGGLKRLPIGFTSA